MVKVYWEKRSNRIVWIYPTYLEISFVIKHHQMLLPESSLKAHFSKGPSVHGHLQVPQKGLSLSKITDQRASKGSQTSFMGSK
jgi:hypothetical protein